MSRYIGVYTDRGMTIELPEILLDGKLVPLLKQAATYLVKVTVDTDSTEVAIVLTWYEVS
ncbi:MAG TPA: hypothetical protein VMW50_03055 [Dehalococcoidia bacterium]|nr:hypothetical protein [Dehalococcoidia bacterium]